MQEQRSKMNLISLYRWVITLDVYYKWPFWKLVFIRGKYELRPRSWLHLIVELISWPFWLMAGLFTLIPKLLDAGVNERSITLHLPEDQKPNKAQLRAIKKRLLMN